MWESRSLPALFTTKPDVRNHAGLFFVLPLIVAAYVGSAGWNIPNIHRERFAPDGSRLQRYASRLNAAEINSSFYRRHKPAVYLRWAAGVPAGFRFAVKMPKTITHDRRLMRARPLLLEFLSDAVQLGSTLGPLLVQLPPSLVFDARRAGRFFTLLRDLHDGPVVCEPRHVTWTAAAADRLLVSHRIARVAADPALAAGLDHPGGWPGIVYYRWHGSPRPYFSPYADEELDRLADRIAHSAVETWCIFDNTGSGAAAVNALDLAARLTRAPRRPLRRTRA